MQVIKTALALGSLIAAAECALNPKTTTSVVGTTLTTSIISHELSTVGTTLPTATPVFNATTTDEAGDSTGLIKPRPSTDSPSISIHACGDTSVINQYSYGSPLVSDCWKVYDNLYSQSSAWVLDHMWQQRAYMSYGTCVIGAQIVSQTDYPSYLGSEDLRRAIKKSIEQFAKKDDKGNELVGTKGYMDCGMSFPRRLR
ncbi:putative necrosis-inducing factor-domain-containing protein [Triangularia verruculosa]|uniref:Necrosis-inducing factor-domain-containing protein n=1 Tax=Triangularia verruculosa TaxID=2587418 RepID=A0AAN6XAW2_9PEZI|nr:putative necrosis-inducing factor-domain-containing protein [Triangularia verruculosa]